MDCSLPGSSVRGIFQARVLEWELLEVYTLFIYLFIFASLYVFLLFKKILSSS